MARKKTNFVESTENAPSVPGVGMGGLVMCPYFKGPCIKGGCELWVELNYNGQMVGRCAVAYQTITTVELRQEVEKLRKELARK